MMIRWYFRWLFLIVRIKHLFAVISKHLPKVRNFKKPPYPTQFQNCPFCGDQYHICALDTGDGWYFFWDCDEHHNEIEFPIVDWFPYIFGWANAKDLRKLGIEIV